MRRRSARAAILAFGVGMGVAAPAGATTSDCVVGHDGVICIVGCMLGVCSSGACIGTVALPDGMICATGNPCTQNDSCLGGVCHEGPQIDCGGDACHVGSCVAGLGCVFTPVCDMQGQGADDASAADAGVGEDAAPQDAAVEDAPTEDAAELPDAAPNDAPDAAESVDDAAPADAGADDAALVDAGLPDSPEDAQSDALAPDAEADAEPDAEDAAQANDASNNPDAPAPWHIYGGGCQCDLSGPTHRGAGWIACGLLLACLGWWRGRRTDSAISGRPTRRRRSARNWAG